MQVALVSLVTGRVHGRWSWPHAARLHVRPHGGAWVLFDDQGRVSVVTLATGELAGVSVR